MSFLHVQILSFSIAIGAIIGLVRLKNTDQAFLPFILFLCSGFLNETISVIRIAYKYGSTINNNIYVLVSALLVLWLFKNWKVLGRWAQKGFYALALLFIVVWVWEVFIYSSIKYVASYFRIVYSFVIVLLSIQMINRLLLEDKTRLLRNPVFLICLSFVVFFTYKVLIEIFWLYGLNSSTNFGIQVFRIMIYVNLAVNLVYALAALWMPRKRESLLQ